MRSLETFDDDFVVRQASELVFIFLSRDVMDVLKMKRNILEIVLDLGMANTAEKVLKKKMT